MRLEFYTYKFESNDEFIIALRERTNLLTDKKHKIIKSQDMCLTFDTYNFGIFDDFIKNGCERTKLQIQNAMDIAF